MNANLIALIDEHLVRAELSEARFARRIGVDPRTVNAWRHRGVKTLPDPDVIGMVAAETGSAYPHVLRAALLDAGYSGARYVTDELSPEPTELRLLVERLEAATVELQSTAREVASATEPKPVDTCDFSAGVLTEEEARALVFDDEKRRRWWGGRR